MKRCTAYHEEKQCPDEARYVADLSAGNDGGPDFQFACLEHRSSLIEQFDRSKVFILAEPPSPERLTEIRERWEHPAEAGYSDEEGTMQDEMDVAELLAAIDYLNKHVQLLEAIIATPPVWARR